jgi:cytochrome c peroxidase
MKSAAFPLILLFGGGCYALAAVPVSEPPLGLPAVPVPADNPMTEAKVTLGQKLYNDKRFSSTGEVACATCHAPETGFTDSPLSVSEGINKSKGTRNAPTVINSAYSEVMFWDGRSPSLEDQALHPFVNPIEMGLKDHDPILEVIRGDEDYKAAFMDVFGVEADAVTMEHVTKAIATFERTVVAGNSDFDRWFYGGEADAMSEQEIRGYELFVGQGRCVSCHVIEETQATFTDNLFHNIGVGINNIQDDIPALAGAYLEAERTLAEVDEEVLSNPKTSELGRFAVDRQFDGIGAFKTPTVRNVAVTAPYMHDGSLKTLNEVLVHYNNGGVTDPDTPVNDFLAGGIRPLNLTDAQLKDLEAFLRALTSPEFEAQANNGGN